MFGVVFFMLYGRPGGARGVSPGGLLGVSWGWESGGLVVVACYKYGSAGLGWALGAEP